MRIDCTEALDQVLPFKETLERDLKERAGTLFHLGYDLFLYDVTSIYVEGEVRVNVFAQRGYSRDRRGDCKQICIGLVVSREGFPLGYELFGGNRMDVTTVEEIMEFMEGHYGKAKGIWVMDRGMVRKENMEGLRKEGRRCILDTQRGQLKKYEGELLKTDWRDWSRLSEGCYRLRSNIQDWSPPKNYGEPIFS